jgi:pimeloyl-ACP methyl ester carboxylesterase
MGHFKGVTPRLLPQLLHPAHLADPALTEPVMAMAERVGPEAFLRQQTAIMGRRDGRADLARIACPALVLCGKQDLLTPPELHEEMAAAIPGATLVTIEQCAHLSPIEQPAQVNAALRRWLDS